MQGRASLRSVGSPHQYRSAEAPDTAFHPTTDGLVHLVGRIANPSYDDLSATLGSIHAARVPPWDNLVPEAVLSVLVSPATWQKNTATMQAGPLGRVRA